MGDYTFMDIDNEGFLTLMAEGGAVREDLKCPAGEVGDDLRAGNESGRDMICTVLSACGEECVIQARPAMLKLKFCQRTSRVGTGTSSIHQPPPPPLRPRSDP